MVGTWRAARSLKVPRSFSRNSSVLGVALHRGLAGTVSGTAKESEHGSLSLCLGHLSTLLEICAGAECCINVARHDQGPGGPVAFFRGDGLDVLRERVEQVMRDRIAGFGSIELQHAYMSRAWGGNLLA